MLLVIMQCRSYIIIAKYVQNPRWITCHHTSYTSTYVLDDIHNISTILRQYKVLGANEKTFPPRKHFPHRKLSLAP